MPLEQAQKTTFKAHKAANTNTIQAYTVADPNTLQSVQIKDVAEVGDNYQFVANWYNLNASPDYFVHRQHVTQKEVYETEVSAGDSSTGAATEWSVQGFKTQSVSEQNAWEEMFEGGQCNFGKLIYRKGVLDLFGTTGEGGKNRTHIFNVAKRRCTNLEKLFVADVPTPPVNTGNVDTNARGDKTNPDLLGFEGTIGAAEVADALVNG